MAGLLLAAPGVCCESLVFPPAYNVSVSSSLISDMEMAYTVRMVGSGPSIGDITVT